ncbi:MAG: MetQ/NlpA family ABC transporter substrate-binding protein [Eubacteriales bacterium]|nr:MetQ/NlpA family ABC transporter substrate-binding protein [Eubacteriales bacterium]
MKKSLALVLVLALSLSSVSVLAETALTPIRVAASANPHEILLNFVKDDLAQAGFDLQVTWIDGYVLQNPATSAGEYDANFFQHRPYLNDYNATVNEEEKLAAVIPVHYEPFGVYPGTKSNLSDIADGDAIAVPNDPSNETRALLLLQEAGLINLPEGANVDSGLTKLDVTAKDKKIEIIEVDAERLPATLADVAFAVINGNYAIPAGLYPTRDAIYLESSEGLAAQLYTNYVVVKAGNENAPFVEALREALHSDKVKQFLLENEDFKGGVVPNFEGDPATDSQ